MQRTSMGRLLVNEALPEDMRDENRVLDKKGINQLLRDLAEKHPDRYVEVSKKLSDIGRTAAMEFGGYTFGLEHLRTSAVARTNRVAIQKKMQQILNNDSLTSDQRKSLIVKTVGSYQQKQIDDIYAEAVKNNNPIAMQAVSGSRGNKMNLGSLLGGDMLYSDHRDEVIPLPVLSSYSEGLKPMEYWAGMYGARRGTMATKFCLARGTLVLMSDFSEKPIERVNPGDTVFTADANGQLLPTRVVRRYDNGSRDCHRFHFREGRSRSTVHVEGTALHEYLSVYRTKRGLTRYGMEPLGRASAGRRSAAVPRGCVGGLVESRAGLLGGLLGDGGLTQHNTNFYCDDPLAAARYSELASAEGLTLKLTYVPSDGADRYTLQDPETPNGHASPFRAWLRELGVLGVSSPDKTIPRAVWDWDEGSCERLAAWLFETDGCFTTATNQLGLSYPVVTFWVTSEHLARDFRRLLWQKLGVYAGPVGRRNVSGRISTFANGRIVQRNHDLHGFVIATRADVRRVAAFWVNTGSKSDALAIAVHGVSNKYADDLPRRFVSADPIGLQETFDLEVEHPSHRFVLANGLIVSNSTQDAGFLSKQLNQVSHRLMVVGEEDDRDIPDRGLPVDTDDGDNEGALLAKDFGPYKRNTVLTPKILKHIKGLGHDRILVRSPLVGGSPDGGVYARDVGVRERGMLPGRGEQVGLTAAQALSEPLAQGQLSAKHSGGVAGQEKAVGGFAYINQLIQVPKVFKGGAVHSEHDGTVSMVESAPAGGNYVWVDDKRHYVPSGVELKVKKGDAIEAGDVLTEGFPNPATVTELKGVGEGKRYFVNAFCQSMRDAGMRVNRRNVELLARGLINHVKLTDEYGDHVPDDVVPYSTMEHLYEPREGHELLDPKKAVGQYLERPVLHYSIGTKVRPSVLKELQHFGVKEVAVHKDPAPFQSNMIRGMYSLQHDPDWMTRMYGSGLKASLLDATHHGGVSDELGTSFVPGLARAVDFGRVGTVRQSEKGYELPPEGQPFGDPRATPATPAPTSILPDATPTPPKKTKQTGTFSGLFKMSEDELQKEAEMFIKRAKMSMAPKVDTTTPAGMGSSTAAPATATRNPVTPAPASTPSYLPGGGLPNMPQGPLAANTPQQPVQQPMQQVSNGPPGTPTTPAAPGQIHPGRLAPERGSDNSWSYGANDNSPQQPNPGNPGPGLFSQFDSPEMAAQFVAGGGDPQRPGSGFGGDFGEVTRFGSLLNQNDVATLTNQGKPLPGETSGERDSLMGYDDAIVPNYKHDLNIMPKQAPALPALSSPSVQGMKNPDALKLQVAQVAGWQAGNEDFDAMKQTLGPGATDAEVQNKLFDLKKRGHLLAKEGYVAGQPKFEQVRNKLKQQVVETVGGNVDQAITEMQAIVANLKETNPTHPDLAKAEQQIKDMQQFKITGISDDEVMEHLKENVQPSSDISDYELLQESRGDNSWWRKTLGAALSPVTASAFSRIITNPVIKPAFRGLHNVATKVPVLNKVPGFRNPIVKKLEEAATSRFGRGLGAAMKGFPLIGAGFEVYKTLNTPEDELRAKFDHKMKPSEGVLDWADKRLDDVINPGQNIGAAATVAGDALGTHVSSGQQAIQTDWTQAAHANATVQHLQQAAKRRALMPDEQELLARTTKLVQDAKAKYDPTGFWDRSFGGNQHAEAFRQYMGKSQLSATETLRNAKAQRGSTVVDQVLSNTANAADVDDFNTWLHTKLEPLHLSVGGRLNDVGYQKGIDARIAELQPILDKATKAGNTAIASKISDAIASVGRTPEQRAAIGSREVRPALPANLQFKPNGGSPFATPFSPPNLQAFPEIPGLTPPAVGIGGFGPPPSNAGQRLEELLRRRQTTSPIY